MRLLEKQLRAASSNFKKIEKRRNFLLTNVDRNDMLDKLFRTTEMNGTDSKKKNKKVVDKRL